jgi:ACR3 family arsenite efflux pump ArsB
MADGRAGVVSRFGRYYLFKTMNRLLDNIQKYLLWWIFGAVALGLLNVKLFGGMGFSSAICLLAAGIMIYPSLVPLDFEKLRYVHKNSGIIGVSLLLNFIVTPLVALLLGHFFLREYPALWVGLMLISLLPGGGMATTWALKSRADMPTVIGIIFTNLIAAVFIVPPALSYILNAFSQSRSAVVSDLAAGGSCAVGQVSGGVLSCASAGSISPMKIIVPIVFIVVVPLIMAYATQRTIMKKKGGTYFEKVKPFFSKFSNFGMVVVLLVLMSLRSNEVVFAHPEMILVSAVPLALFYLIQFAVIIATYKRFYANKKGRSLVWGSYLRYITLALGLVTSLIYADPSLGVIVVIVILSYFIQIPTSFLIARYLDSAKTAF